MVSCAVLLLTPVWIQAALCAGEADLLPREVLLARFRERFLEGLGLTKPPDAAMRGPEVRRRHARVPRGAARPHPQTSPDQEASQMILFPVPDSEPTAGPNRTSFRFQPSASLLGSAVASARFWFHAGDEPTPSGRLVIVPSTAQPLQAAEGPAELSADGWATYELDPGVLAFLSTGPFVLQVNGPACGTEESPFVHLDVRARGPRREAPLTLPWSPSALALLQRPASGEPPRGDCRREGLHISFEELGWENWIVQPRALSFQYCRGNCSGPGRTAAALGLAQCCAPLPGAMSSVKVTTTSDGGFSFRHETLPNIMAEECACF